MDVGNLVEEPGFQPAFARADGTPQKGQLPICPGRYRCALKPSLRPLKLKSDAHACRPRRGGEDFEGPAGFARRNAGLHRATAHRGLSRSLAGAAIRSWTQSLGLLRSAPFAV